MAIDDIQSNWNLPPWLIPKETPTQSLLAGAQVGNAMAQTQNQRMAIAQQGNIAFQNIALNKQRMDMMQRSNDLQMQIGQNQLEDRMNTLQGSSDLADAISGVQDFTKPEQLAPVYGVFKQYPVLWNSPAGKDFQGRLQMANQASIWQERGETARDVASTRANAYTQNAQLRADTLRDVHTMDNSTKLKIEDLKTNEGIQKASDIFNNQFANNLDEFDRASLLEQSKAIMANDSTDPNQKLTNIANLQNQFRQRAIDRRNSMAPNPAAPSAAPQATNQSPPPFSNSPSPTPDLPVFKTPEEGKASGGDFMLPDKTRYIRNKPKTQ